MGYKIYPGDHIHTQINYQDVRMMERVVDGKASCSNRVFDECIYEAVEGRMMDEANCTVPWTINSV